MLYWSWHATHDVQCQSAHQQEPAERSLRSMSNMPHLLQICQGMASNTAAEMIYPSICIRALVAPLVQTGWAEAIPSIVSGPPSLGW